MQSADQLKTVSKVVWKLKTVSKMVRKLKSVSRVVFGAINPQGSGRWMGATPKPIVTVNELGSLCKARTTKKKGKNESGLRMLTRVRLIYDRITQPSRLIYDRLTLRSRLIYDRVTQLSPTLLVAALGCRCTQRATEEH